MSLSVVEIVPEQVLVLFRPGTTLFRFGLGIFFVPEPDLAKHFRSVTDLIDQCLLCKLCKHLNDFRLT